MLNPWDTFLKEVEMFRRHKRIQAKEVTFLAILPAEDDTSLCDVVIVEPHSKARIYCSQPIPHAEAKALAHKRAAEMGGLQVLDYTVHTRGGA